MKHLSSCIAICMLILFSACKKKTTEPETTNPAIAQNFLDVNYGADVKQKFNIYLPANRTTSSTPVLFLIHGGAWRAGDRSDFNSLIDGFKALFPNYAIVTLSYRLYNAGVNKFPIQEMDTKSGVEYVLNNRNTYQISDKFALVGFSAGAHLSLLYAYKYGASSFNPKAVVSFYGPTDFIKCYNTVSSPLVKSWLSDVAGNVQTADSLVYIAASPERFVTAGSAPTLLLHGDSDTIVPYQQSALLNQKLTQLNVPHTYKLYPNQGHGFTGASSNDAILTLQSFLNTHIQ